MNIFRQFLKYALYAVGYLAEVIGYWVLCVFLMSGFSLGRALTLLYGISERYLVMGEVAQRSIWIFLAVTASPFVLLVFYFRKRSGSKKHHIAAKESKAWT